MTLQVFVPRQSAYVSHSFSIEWGCKENRVAVIALHKCGNQILKFLNSWNHWKFRKISSIGQLNIIRNSGALKTGLGQDARGVWGLRPLSKQCGSLFAEIRSWNRIPCPASQTYRLDRCHASSGTLYTWEPTGGRRDTSLLPFWRRYDRQELCLSCSGTPRTGTKTFSSRTRKSSPSRSSINARTTRFTLKHPVRQRRRFRGSKEAITLLPLGVVGVSH